MFLQNFSFRARMFLLVVISFAALAATHGMYLAAIRNVEVNGPLYQEIALSKDLVADILPPSQFIVESYVVVLRLMTEQGVDQEEMIARFKKLEAEYETRHAYWERTLPEGKRKEAVVGNAYRHAREFYRDVNKEVIQPLEQGKKREELQPDWKKIGQLYTAHRDEIKDVVQMARRRVELNEEEAKQSNRFWGITQIIVAVLTVLVIALVGWVISRGIVVPTAGLIERMKDMAEGPADLTKRVDVESTDEIGQLSALINAVIQRLHDLIAHIRVSTIQLNATATQIAASASEQNSTVQHFHESTSRIASAVREITASEQELAETVSDVLTGACETSSLADRGRAGLGGMQATMQQLAEATGSISTKLGVIRDKAGGINTVVTTITKVADQTNLLSINAAIEAEKAGEAGRGFLVVAREIRRLADQTAVATLDIEQMVRHMQAAVSAGVMEMDKFNEEVRNCISQVAQISTQMGQLIEGVQTLRGRFQEVNEGIHQQTEAVKQIDETMVQLSSGVRQVSGSATDFTSAAENLRESAQGLQRELSLFTVSG